MTQPNTERSLQGHAAYVEHLDEAQLESLISTAQSKLEALRSSGWTHLWTVSIGWTDVAWFAEENFDAAAMFAQVALAAEFARKPGKQVELEVMLDVLPRPKVRGFLLQDGHVRPRGCSVRR